MEGNEITIDYALNSGSPGSEAPTSKVYETDLTSAISDPTKDYYTFAGWNLDSDAEAEIAAGANAATQSAAIDENYATNTAEEGQESNAYNHAVTLTALWEANTYTLSFNADDYDTGSLPEDMTATYADIASKVVPNVDVTKEGYTADGWILENDTTDTNNKIAAAATLNTIFDSDGNTTQKKNAYSSKSATLWVNWVENTYTVNLNKGAADSITASSSWTEGTGLVSKTTELSKSIILPTVVEGTVNSKANEIAFAIEDNTFMGWDTDSSADEVVYADGATVSYSNSTPINLYPVFSSSLEYDIEFAKGEGTGEMDPIENISDGKKITLPASTFTKEHASFSGWNDGSHTFQDKAEVTVNATNLNFVNGVATLTAQYTEDKYTVIFMNEGQTKQKTKVDYSENVTTPSVSSSGKTLLGWDEDSTVTEPAYPVSNGGTTTVSELCDEANGTVTLYAIYVDASSKVTVTYNSNNSAQTVATAGTKEVSAVKNTDITLPDEESSGFTVDDNYVLGGWTLEKSEGLGKGYASYDEADKAGAIIDSPYTITADVTLYAVWKERTIQVAFDANGGTGSMDSMSATYDATNHYKLGKLTANSFTRAGYEFTGWAEEATGAKVYDDEEDVTIDTADTNELTLYAVWSAYEYRITFDKNSEDASGSMSDLVGTSEDFAASYLTVNGFVSGDENYEFAGWALSADAEEAQFEDAADVSAVIDAADADDGATITLYAVWTKTALAEAEKAAADAEAEADAAKSEADAAKSEAASAKSEADAAKSEAATAKEAQAKAEEEAKAAKASAATTAQKNVETTTGETVTTSANGTATLEKVSTIPANGKYTVPTTVTVNGQEYTVTKIDAKAFAKNNKIKEITIGENIVEIGKAAFRKDKKLKKIVIQGKDVVIRANAFKNINKKAKIFVKDKDTKVNVTTKGGAPESVKVKIKK